MAGMRCRHCCYKTKTPAYTGSRLTKIISCVPSALKWKLLHQEELRTWTKVRLPHESSKLDCFTDQTAGQHHVALLGDACHPTLPYQAQGAAMAVEDGAVLGVLLGNLNRSGLQKPASHIPDIFRLYEALQKTRTTTNVKGAIANQQMYHMPDGPEQRARDAELAIADWKKSSSFLWADMEYQKSLLAFDSMGAAEKAFDRWIKDLGQGHSAPVL